MSNPVNIGDDVKVVSGPHEGRAGRVVYMRNVSLDNREEEPYAVIEYLEVNSSNERYADHICVPARRTVRK